ncbi:MAG: Flavobacterium phage vB FspM pippi8 [Bacteroidota bacterium]|jgi:hypothetical protein
MGAGQPPYYNSPDELQNKIDEYFKSGINTRKVIIGKGEDKTEIEVPVPTISGLAIFLGFESRQSLYDYGKRPEYSYIIKKAQFFIERGYEEQLQVGNTVGAIFALKNMGWIDKMHNENTNIEKPIFSQLNLDVEENDSTE